MKLTTSLIGKLRKLTQGEAIAYSSISRTLSKSLESEGLLTTEYHGTKRRLRAPNPKALMAALQEYNEALRDLDIAAEIVDGVDSRAMQATLSGNSKTRAVRSCPGFLVNTYGNVECMLGGRNFSIHPPEGSAVYISDWKSFIPPTSALIVGVENMENFLTICKQKKLIESFLMSNETGVIFVARYAFSSDLAEWLHLISNRYLHFGDFDLAGIEIFLTQFKPYVRERGSFLIPPDIEERISNGSRQRYDGQYAKYSHLTTQDPALNRLIALIHRYRRTYDQEGYIDTPRY